MHLIQNTTVNKNNSHNKSFKCKVVSHAYQKTIKLNYCEMSNGDVKAMRTNP